jgi:CSLREA domain-containing protein
MERSGGHVIGSNRSQLGLKSFVAAVGVGLLCVPSLLSAQTLVPPAGYTVVYPFGGGAAYPQGGLLRGQGGTLYGTSCGINGQGTVFSIDAAWHVTTLHSWSGGADGTCPLGPLAQTPDGMVYGTTYTGGGAVGAGTAFRLAPDGSSFYKFHDFAPGEGGNPQGLTLGPDGNLYGLMLSGGTAIRITTSEIETSPATAVSVIASFQNPTGSLMVGNDGLLYGTTVSGDGGAVFKMDLTGNVTWLHSFEHGERPWSGLVQASDGNFYGTTGQSATGYGSVFRMTPEGVVTSIHDFSVDSGPEGMSPMAPLFQATDGNLYGTAQMGGLGYGTVFTIALPSLAFSIVHTFDDRGAFGVYDGQQPLAPVVEGADGVLYGTASRGGSNSLGTVYALTSATVTQLTVSPANAAFGGPASLSATLTAGALPVNVRPVEFRLNGRLVGTTTTDIDGAAVLGSVDITGLHAGTYPGVVHAAFAGDGSYLPASGIGNLVVARAATTTTLTASPNPAQAGDPVSLAAAVTPADVGAQVGFFDGATLLGSTPLDASGVARFTVTGLAAGAHSLTATFPGDGDYLPSDSAAVVENVQAVSSSQLQLGVSSIDFGRLNVGSRTLARSFGVGPLPEAVAVADFNGDGKPDVAATAQGLFTGTGAVTILLGDGSGGFARAGDLTAARSARGIAAADLNHDGAIDLVVGSESEAAVRVFIGHGDGTFAAAVPYQTPSPPFGVAAADLNGDGHPDLVAASGQVAVLLGTGDGGFLPARTFAAAGTDVVVADMDGDGRADVVTSGAVLLSNGDGTLQTGTSLGVVGVSVAVADLNGDGRPDVVVPNHGGSNLWVFYGSGGGAFEAAITVPTCRQPWQPSVADMDADGRMDLVVSCEFDSSVAVLHGNAAGFDPAVLYGFAAFAEGIAVADINGDGSPDVAIADEIASTASVFLNKGDGTLLASRTIPLRNSGTVAVHFSGLRLTGADPSSFFIEANACGSTLDPGQACVLVVGFAPQTPEPASAVLEIGDDAPDAPQHIALSGVGVAPTPTLAWTQPPAIAYGTPLGLSQLNATASVPGTFAYSPPAGTVLNAGLNQTLSATFTPQDSTYAVTTVTTTIDVLRIASSITMTAAARGVNRVQFLADMVPPLSFGSGSVSFVEAGQTLVTVPLVDGHTGFEVTASPGPHTFTAVFGGTGNVLPSTSSPMSIVAGIAVNSAADQDDGRCDAVDCSLREAIAAANTTPGRDYIVFGIPGSGPFSIRLLTQLPAITDSVLLDATTQPGFAGTPLIEIDGSALGVNFTGPGFDGLTLNASESLIRGFIINRFTVGSQFTGGNGIVVNGQHNLIAGNYLGTDRTGTLPAGNGGSGVLVNGSANRIGGIGARNGNVIADNWANGASANGVYLAGGTQTVVQGNYIGTDASGLHAIGGNFNGIRVDSGDNTIGGPGGAGNLVSGNRNHAVLVSGNGNRIQGNVIGFTINRATDIGGGDIQIFNGSGNLIGGLTPAFANLIGAVWIPFGGTGNAIEGNSIVGGITLGLSGSGLNDAGDADTGANALQNFPVITGASGDASGGQVSAFLRSASNTSYRIEFFANPACDPSAFGPGQIYLGAATLLTDAAGLGSAALSLDTALTAGTVTATATDPLGNTSQFSACRDVNAAPVATLPESIGFGVVPIGTTVHRSLTIRNDGAGPMAVDDIATSGPFVLSPWSCVVIATGQSCALDLAFSAAVAEARSGSVTIFDNAGGPHVVALTANDSAPLTAVVVSPNGGEKVFVGVPLSVRWTATGSVTGHPASIDIALSTNGGSSFANITACFNLPGAQTACTWTPAATSGNARIRVTARDADGLTVSDASDASFTIAAGPPAVTVAVPNTAVVWTAGTVQTIKWTDNLGPAGAVNLDLSRDGGTTWEPLASGVVNTSNTAGSFQWTVTGPPTLNALVRATWTNGTISDSSNAAFAIAAPALTVASPNTAVTWRAGSTQNIKLSHNLGAGQPVSLDVSHDGGLSWAPAGTVTTTGAGGTFAWTVTGPPTANALIRATWAGHPAVTDTSDAAFIISPRVAVTAPNTAVLYGGGSTRTVTWNHNLGPADTVDIAFSSDGGASWQPLAANVPNATATTGNWTGRMPDVVTGQALIRVSQSGDPSEFDDSDVPFSLAAPSIALTAPTTNVNWAIGTVHAINYSHNLGTQETARIELSRDGGATWGVLASAVTNTANTKGSFNWTVDGPATATALIRIAWLADPSVAATSAVAFRIH